MNERQGMQEFMQVGVEPNQDLVQRMWMQIDDLYEALLLSIKNDRNCIYQLNVISNYVKNMSSDTTSGWIISLVSDRSFRENK